MMSCIYVQCVYIYIQYTYTYTYWWMNQAFPKCCLQWFLHRIALGSPPCAPKTVVLATIPGK